MFGESDWLDGQFPLGDGVADTDAVVPCPCCGEAIELELDPGGAAVQCYVEDCPVCCRPLQLTVRWDRNGAAEVLAVPEEGA